MSRSPNKTTTGESNGTFRTTHWTEIFDARSDDEPRRHKALNELARQYWKPIYYFLRCKGYPHDEAKDLTQDFFCDVVLGQDLVQKADPAKGRFRTFLLAALVRYVGKVHRAQKAKRRTPEGGLVSLEHVDWLNVPEPAHVGTPTEAFDYAWATTLLDQVHAVVATKCHEAGNPAHWGLFRARFLLPFMDNTEPASLAHLCEKYGISGKARASKIIHKVKHLFRATLRRHVRQFVGSDAEVDEEVRYLMKIFFRNGGRSPVDLGI